MQTFEEPEILLALPRVWRASHEELRLERGSYEGRPTFTLRLVWKNQNGEWRWSQARPTSSGKAWQALNLRPSELAALGEALTAAARALPSEPADEEPRPRPIRKATPREQHELDRFDAEHPTFRDSDIPF